MIGKSYRRKVKRVIDGDTFEIYRSILGKRFVRLANVNTPEKGQRGYMKAKKILQDLIEGKTVTIIPVHIGRRVIAEVILNRRSINRMMNGMGY